MKATKNVDFFFKLYWDSEKHSLLIHCLKSERRKERKTGKNTPCFFIAWRKQDRKKERKKDIKKHSLLVPSRFAVWRFIFPAGIQLGQVPTGRLFLAVYFFFYRSSIWFRIQDFQEISLKVLFALFCRKCLCAANKKNPKNKNQRNLFKFRKKDRKSNRPKIRLNKIISIESLLLKLNPNSIQEWQCAKPSLRNISPFRYLQRV